MQPKLSDGLQSQKEGKNMDTDVGTRKLLDLTELSRLVGLSFLLFRGNRTRGFCPGLSQS